MVNPEDLGEIKINNDVVALIASIALTEVEGVVSISGKSTFSDYVGFKSKDVEKGVTVQTDEASGLATIHIEVNMEYGVPVRDAALKLQHAVKNAVENYAGLTVDKVNVTVKGLTVNEQPRPARGKIA